MGSRGDHFRFGSVFIKKNNQTEFKKTKPNRNRFKPTSFSTVRFVFRTKTGSNRFGSVFSVWLGFFGLARFFSVWVWFCFFGFRLIKLNRTGWFFQNFNQFFLRFGFFGYFFLVFSGFLFFYLPLDLTSWATLLRIKIMRFGVLNLRKPEWTFY